MKLITFVDLEGRYRITTPAYNDETRPEGETDDECLERVWALIVNNGVYGIDIDHPHHYVEDSVLHAKVDKGDGGTFRYAGKPDADGRRDGKYGAWEMDTDGTPKVNMAKARGVQMDRIRVVRNKELAKKDVDYTRALEADDGSAAAISIERQKLRDIPQTFDLTTDTAEELKEKWPEGLPKE